jgi:catalase
LNDQRRLWQHHHSHIHRLGSNYHLIPVNAPRNAPKTNYLGDGFLRVQNIGGGPDYWPKSFGGPAPDPAQGEPPFPVEGLAGMTREERAKAAAPGTHA